MTGYRSRRTMAAHHAPRCIGLETAPLVLCALLIGHGKTAQASSVYQSYTWPSLQIPYSFSDDFESSNDGKYVTKSEVEEALATWEDALPGLEFVLEGTGHQIVFGRPKVSDDDDDDDDGHTGS